MDFMKVKLADAEIQICSIKDGEAIIEYKDWQAKIWRLTFVYVIGLIAFSPEGEPLSHGLEECRNDTIEQSCKISGEEVTSDFKMFSFISAWSSEKILSIVAKSFRIEQD